MNESPTFAVVVPTYNEEQNIERLLRSITSQLACTYSIVVVDQSSTDRTGEIARSYGCTVVNLPKPSFYTPPARSRNVGARSIEGEILLHLDADMELGSTDFLMLLKGLIDFDHRAAVIPESDEADGFWAQCKALERSCYRGTSMESARAVTRDLFFRIGGYDEEISSGEDFYVTEMYARETQLATAPSLFLRHYVGHQSLRSLVSKKFAYGRTASTYLHKARKSGGRRASSIMWSSLRAYLRNWRLLGRRPAHYLCIFPLRALEVTAMQLGMWFGPRTALPPSQSNSASRI
jgi:glycosyltransferase involved in cell wall biosynthesis